MPVKTALQCDFHQCRSIYCLPFQNTHKAAFYCWLSDGELVGSIAYFAGQNSAPDGWVLCDGSAVSRDTYASLFATVGTTYGAGDGSTTFTLPDLVDKFIEGSATAGTEKSAGLPNITGMAGDTGGWIAGFGGNQPFTNGAITATLGINGTTASIAAQSTNVNMIEVTFDASNSNSIYGNSTTVQPPALTMRPFIYTGKTSQYKWLRTA